MKMEEKKPLTYVEFSTINALFLLWLLLLLAMIVVAEGVPYSDVRLSLTMVFRADISFVSDSGKTSDWWALNTNIMLVQRRCI